MGFSSILKRFIVNVTILVLFITFMPGLLPDVSISKSFRVMKESLIGKFTPNKKLDKMELLFKGDLLGPESFADDKNYVYTSLQTGDIVKISGKHIIPFVKFGKPCKGIYQEQICGRPLGLSFGSDGYLYAADAYYGIFKVDVDTGDKTNLVPFGEEIEGKPTKIPNNLAVSCGGDVYWSDSSSNFLLYDGLYTFLDDPSGRLIHYNAKTGKNKVLVDGGHFTNGVALSKTEDFVIVSDSRNQILRYYLRGSKAGTTDIFVRLPGIPDNIESDGGSGFLVSIIVESNQENPHFLNLFAPFPNIRRFFARSLSLAELGFRFVDKLYPNEFCQKIVHYIGNFIVISTILKSRSIVVHISENGEILDTLWTSNITLGSYSEAYIVKNQLYLGSPFNDYIGRIPLSEVGWQHLSRKTDSLTAKKQLCSALNDDMTPKVAQATTTTSKITTTTQKPPTSQKPATTSQKSINTSGKSNTDQKPTFSSQKPTTTTTQQVKTTTSKPIIATQKPTTTTSKPIATTQKQTKTAHKPTTITQKLTTTTQKPAATQKLPNASTPKTKSVNAKSATVINKDNNNKKNIPSNSQDQYPEKKKSATNVPKNEL